MDNNTKSLIKNTILGLIGGGALSAAYAVNQAIRDKKDYEESTKNDIVVPLSKKNFMSSVKNVEQKKEPVAKSTSEKRDVSSMTPNDLAALKKELLKKRASAPTKIVDKNGPASSVSTVRRAKSANYATLRNDKGRFSTEENLAKKASSVMEDAKGVALDAAGGFGGLMTGMFAVKAIADKIIINRKKRQLDQSRQRYADLINREVNDTDLPYYNSKRAEDRSGLGKTLGVAGIAGAGTAGVVGMVVYKIMENRRKAEERASDIDMSRYPDEKTVKFKFASEKEKKGASGFFA